RDKATSNICTAQVLLAVMAGAYAVYHGPEGLRGIAERVRGMTGVLRGMLQDHGCEIRNEHFFDTLHVVPNGREARDVLERALARGINLRDCGDGTVCVAFDETVGFDDVLDVAAAFGVSGRPDAAALAERTPALPEPLARDVDYLQHPVFHAHRSETEMLRYLHRLQAKDLSLTTSMIPLGSCTMKLNATAEMIPVTFPGFANVHPFA